MTDNSKNPSRSHPSETNDSSPTETGGWDQILSDTPDSFEPDDIHTDEDIEDATDDMDEMPLMLPHSFDEEDDPDFADDEDHMAMPTGRPDREDMDRYSGNFSELAERMDDVQQQLGRMEKEFQSKLKYDAHKNKIIDELHGELQVYKDDILKKHIKSFVLDLIQFSDNLRKLFRHYENMELGPAEAGKLLRILESLPSDIEDILFRQGVESFESDSGVFDPARQRALKRVPVGDEEKNGRIAERIHPGFEWDEILLRPELISAYIHQPRAAGPSEKEQGNE